MITMVKYFTGERVKSRDDHEEKRIMLPCRERILICSSSFDANYWEVLKRRKFTEARKESRLKKKEKLEKEKERKKKRGEEKKAEEKEEDKSLTYILGRNELFVGHCESMPSKPVNKIFRSN